MPQLTLEYSENIIEQSDLNNLLVQCHHVLAETLPTDIASCKSRAIGYKTYRVGNGQSDTAFIHVRLQVMPGRTEDTLQTVGHSMMDVLANYFSQSLQQLNLQITLEIGELSTSYFKITSQDKPYQD